MTIETQFTLHYLLYDHDAILSSSSSSLLVIVIVIAIASLFVDEDDNIGRESSDLYTEEYACKWFNLERILLWAWIVDVYLTCFVFQPAVPYSIENQHHFYIKILFFNIFDISQQ